MLSADVLIGRLAVALGIGLVIGLERERWKRSGPTRKPAGVRTFAMTSLAGALSLGMGDEIVSATLFLALLVALAYRRTAETDPGSSSTPSGG